MSKARDLAVMISRSADIKAGTTAFFGMSSAPSGWLKANGAAVSRAAYSDLFSAIGTTFGDGDGSTTFNIPDLRGEFPRGWDDSRGIDSGRSIGSAQASTRAVYGHGVDTGGYNPLSYGGLRGHGDTLAMENPDDSTSSYFQVNTTADITGGISRSSRIFMRAIRPRNIALLACIKY